MCFLVIGMGLPLSAKSTGTDGSTHSTASKAGTKGISSSPLAHSSVATQEKRQSHKKLEITLTPDTSRGESSPSLVAKKESPSPTPTTTVSSQERAGTETSPLVTKNVSTMIYASGVSPVRTESGPVTTEANPGHATAGGRLARVTAYWAAEGDYYTGQGISSTGVRLHDGHCAVDPKIIPYGSIVEIAGVGRYLAVDTGSAVISRTAAREGGHTSEERNAIVVDLYFESRVDGEKFAASASKYVSISWWTPTSMATAAKAARNLFAEEDWSKIESKQL
jgi:3D (Asp-Asp-Asp) domain-containing protein